MLSPFLLTLRQILITSLLFSFSRSCCWGAWRLPVWLWTSCSCSSTPFGFAAGGAKTQSSPMPTAAARPGASSSQHSCAGECQHATALATVQSANPSWRAELAFHFAHTTDSLCYIALWCDRMLLRYSPMINANAQHAVRFSPYSQALNHERIPQDWVDTD